MTKATPQKSAMNIIWGWGERRGNSEFLCSVEENYIYNDYNMQVLSQEEYRKYWKTVLLKKCGQKVVAGSWMHKESK